MKSFEDLYIETVQLFEQGLYKNKNWKSKIISNLTKLQKMWPSKEVSEIADIVKDNPWRVEQIKLWTKFDNKEKKSQIEQHGSLNFYFLSKMLSQQHVDGLLSRFHKTNSGNSSNNHVLTEMTLRKIEDTNTDNSYNNISNDDLIVKQCNALNVQVWEDLLNDCVVWEFDQSFIDLLERIKQTRYKITKKDTLFFISQIEELLNRKYLDQFKYEPIHRIFSYN